MSASAARARARRSAATGSRSRQTRAGGGPSEGSAGAGKSGGVRVIYVARSQAGELVLLTIYTKSHTEALKAITLKELRDAYDH